jgi:hypothetical protein
MLYGLYDMILFGAVRLSRTTALVLLVFDRESSM